MIRNVLGIYMTKLDQVSEQKVSDSGLLWLFAPGDRRSPCFSLTTSKT
jgi:hypothetical protein